MICSVIIPVGNFATNKENLASMIASAPAVDFEFIVVVDTVEAEGFEEISGMLKSKGDFNSQVLKSDYRNPGGTRNLGKAVAKSEWIMFCDCDDQPDFGGITAAIFESTTSDNVILASFNLRTQPHNVESYFANENLEERFLEIAHKPGLWRWILRKSAISNIDFQSLSMGEDQLFILECLIKNPEFKSSQNIVYTYNSGVVNSLTSAKTKIRDLVEVIGFENEKVIFDPQIRRLRNYLVFKQILSLLQHGDMRTKFFSIRTELRILNREVFLDQIRMLRFILKRRRNRLND
jgi:glycosyltransferase involved in cell wall biosynthesis